MFFESVKQRGIHLVNFTLTNNEYTFKVFMNNALLADFTNSDFAESLSVDFCVILVEHVIKLLVNTVKIN